MRPFILVSLLFLTGCAGIQGALFDLGVATEREHAGLTERSVEIDGMRLHYLERSGLTPTAPTVLLLHGFAGSKDHWVRFARYLPPCYRVLALDLPGHGDNSPDSTKEYSISYFTSSVVSFVDEVAGGSVHLVGNSLGGQIAAEFSLANSTLTRTLSLLDPAGLASPEPSEFVLALARGENLLIPTTRLEYEAFSRIAFGDKPPNLPWPSQNVLSRRNAERAPLYRKMWSDLFADRTTLENRLPNLQTPALLIWGEKDGVLDVSAASRWAELVPDLEVEILLGVGHGPMIEQPEESATIVADFLSRTVSR